MASPLGCACLNDLQRLCIESQFRAGAAVIEAFLVQRYAGFESVRIATPIRSGRLTANALLQTWLLAPQSTLTVS